METLLQDLKFGARLLLKSPGFTAVASLTLALPIGANSAVFSVVNGLLYSVLPYPDEGRLVRIWSTNLKRGFNNSSASYPDYEDWKKRSRTFAGTAIFTGTLLNLTGVGEPEGLRATRCSSSLFSVLKRAPTLGRTFLPEEERPGADPVVIISYGLWQRRFAGEPDILGKTISLDNISHTAIGIMPEDFFFPDPRNELWVPHRIDPSQAQRGSRSYSVVGRLADDASLEQAQADLSAVAAQLAREYPNSNEGFGIALMSLRRQSIGQDEMLLITMVYLAVTFVLLIACANVANLLLARAASREKEIAIRMSFGSSRGRLVRQLLTESVMLAMLGGIFGLIFGFWFFKALLAIAPADMPNRDTMGMNQWALLYTLTLSLLSGLIFGTAPALQATGRRIQDALKEGGRASAGRARHRLLSAFVVSEVAMAIMLLVCGGLMVRSFIGRMKVDPGFDARNLLTMRIMLPEHRYSKAPQQIAFFRDFLARAQTIPGARAVAAVQTLPLDGSSWMSSFFIEGRPPALPGEQPIAGLLLATPDYFRALRIPLQLGRFFTESDDVQHPAAIINQTMARQYFHDESNPIGQRITLGRGGPQSNWMPIVGVVADVHHQDLGEPPRPEIYVPYAQQTSRRMTIVVRTDGEPLSYVNSVRSAVWAVDRDQPVSAIRSMERVIEDRIGAYRAVTQVMGALSLCALLLAAVGIFGMLSYAVSERTHEIGVRMALGAQRGDICRVVLFRGIALVLVGLGIGIPGALGSMRYLSSQLFGVRPTDPLTYATTSLVLCGVALAAMLLPARRAMAVDPVLALRSE